MSAVENATRNLAEAIGCGLAVLASKPWHSTHFGGHVLLVEADADLPATLGSIEFDVPGFVVADMAQITARRAELLLVEA